jgi:hypothetical protein
METPLSRSAVLAARIRPPTPAGWPLVFAVCLPRSAARIEAAPMPDRVLGSSPALAATTATAQAQSRFLGPARAAGGAESASRSPAEAQANAPGGEVRP